MVHRLTFARDDALGSVHLEFDLESYVETQTKSIRQRIGVPFLV